MVTIDLKLKTYEQLQFEVNRLMVDNFLKQKELEQHKNNWEELKEYIKKFPEISYASSEKVDGERLGGKLIPTTKVLNKMKELEEDK